MKAPLRLPAALLLAATLSFAPARAAEPLAQDYTVVFHNPDPEYYVEGCGLTKLAQDTFLAVVPVVPRLQWSEERRVEHSVIHLLRSEDAGRTWQEVSHLPYYSAVPWQDGGHLYLFANKPSATHARNDDLLLLRSDDGGRTWSEPVTLFKGHYWNCDTGMVIRDHHLFWAVDDLSLGQKRGPRLVAGDLTQDPMNPAAWRISNVVPFPGVPEALMNPKYTDELPSQYLEPNVLELKGHIRVLAVVKPRRQTTTNLCAVFDSTDDGQKLELHFTEYSAMPGGHLKFCVFRDEPSRLFWATANLGVDSQGAFDWYNNAHGHGYFRGDSDSGGNDRRFLMLQYSADGLNWFQAGCVARAAKISQSFMYARPVVDGDDLAIIARSSVNAPNQHDADTATFHRVRDFRNLALDLYPKPE